MKPQTYPTGDAGSRPWTAAAGVDTGLVGQRRPMSLPLNALLLLLGLVSPSSEYRGWCLGFCVRGGHGNGGSSRPGRGGPVVYPTPLMGPHGALQQQGLVGSVEREGMDDVYRGGGRVMCVDLGRVCFVCYYLLRVLICGKGEESSIARLEVSRSRGRVSFPIHGVRHEQEVAAWLPV